jgi:hypothetical protein
LVFIRRPARKGDGFGAVVGDDPPGPVPLEHLDIGDEPVMDRDQSPGAAALSRPVDDQLVGGQACQCPPDGLEVVAPPAALGDQLNDLGQPHPVIGDSAPAAQQRENGRQDLPARPAQMQL